MSKWKVYLICLLGMVQFTAIAAPKEKKDKSERPRRVYMFGAAMGFNDSTVYLTDVQYVDSVIITTDGALQNYANYSLQLKVYLEGTLGENHQTCAVIYSDKRRKVENKLSEMRYKYDSHKNKVLKKISKEDFTFQRR